ncbi:MAG: cytochrome d ubiquinol oxidase subunit II [Bacteroidales bacterium]|nr:cytochrome d ubiquinol oxidase subunit II [Bacteroidales bacterium]
MSIVAGVLATVLVPLIFWFVKTKRIWALRIVAGAQVLLVITGWFVVQWPDFIVFSDESSLNIYNTQAPFITMKILFWSLFGGVLIIFPSLYYLFKIFK